MEFVTANIEDGKSKTFVFPKNVTRSIALVRGLHASYHGKRYEIESLNVQADTVISGNEVTVYAHCRLTDCNGHDAPDESLDIVCLVDY